MKRRERLMNTLMGKAVDRPAICFYEINALDQNPNDSSPFNIYSDPSWQSLLDLTREKTDRIPRRGLPSVLSQDCPLEALTKRTIKIESGSRITTTEIQCKDRVLKTVVRRDPDVDTNWTLEHLLKDVDDLKAYLELPLPKYNLELNINPIIEAEKEIGDSGIVLIDVGDPLCRAASLFNMEDYLLIAFTEQDLFHQLLKRFLTILSPLVEKTAITLPGRLWRVVGAEYASAPYLPPELFRQYLTDYDKPLVESIQKYGGFARIHSHGNLHGILDHIANTGCTGLDPIEPPPQGDVALSYVRARVGKQMVLYGNLEVSDIETLPTSQLVEKVKRALDEGTQGPGRGFVLMPSACPYGRKLSPLTLQNYEAIVETAERF